MRKLLGLVALGVLLSSSASAEMPQKRNEFFLGVGDAGLIFELEHAVVEIGSLGAVKYGSQEGGFQIVAGYQRRFTRFASAGLTASWAGSRRTVYVLGEDAGKSERQLISLLADGRAHWLARRHVDLYSGVAIGFTQLSDKLGAISADENDNFLGFHVIIAGVRVGRDMAGFLELGAGWNGILKAGVNARI